MSVHVFSEAFQCDILSEIHEYACTFIRRERVPVHYCYSVTLRRGTYFACKYVTH